MKTLLPFAARQSFLEKGYAVIPGVLEPNAVQELRSAVLEAAAARRRQLCEVPPITTIFQQQSKFSDPSLTAMATTLERRRWVHLFVRSVQQRRRERARVVRTFLKGRKKEDLSGEDLWKLSALLQEAVDAASQQKISRSTIHSDPQLLRAISAHRVNLWMTNQRLEALIRRPSFTEPLAALAEEVGGVEKPVVFSDAPIYREPFGGGSAYQCSATTIGTRTAGAKLARAVSMVLFTYTPSSICFDPHVLSQSHRSMRDQIARGWTHRSRHKLLEKLHSSFLLSQFHMPYQVQHCCCGPTQGERLLSKVPEPISPGDILVADPHLFLGFGPNFTPTSEAVYQLNVVSSDCKPSMKSPSWIREWRSLAHDVSFQSPAVFPPLQRSL